jgi:hypothetical protein
MPDMSLPVACTVPSRAMNFNRLMSSEIGLQLPFASPALSSILQGLESISPQLADYRSRFA